MIYAFEHQPKLADVERECLRQSLIRHAGNRAQVAAVLGISERNIYRLIKLYELDS